MTEVLFLTSVQGHAVQRVQSVSERLKKRLPDLDVKVVDGSKNQDLMAKYKVKFGPAVLIDGRLEFIGIPRLSMLLDRVLQVRDHKENPRGSGDKPSAVPARPPGAPAAPARPPTPATAPSAPAPPPATKPPAPPPEKAAPG